MTWLCSQSEPLPASNGKLTSEALITGHPPTIIMDQVSVLLVNHSTMITVHNCCSSDTAGTARRVFNEIFERIRET